MKYSIFSLIHQAFRQQQDWKPAWREPEPKREYDIIIIGGGGHGLATAYYLAKEHEPVDHRLVLIAKVCPAEDLSSPRRQGLQQQHQGRARAGPGAGETGQRHR